jgi:Leucine-rich repeat (LRR) protein
MVTAQMELLDLSANEITLPTNIGSLEGTIVNNSLNLSAIGLFGTLPASLSALTSLRSLDLSRNDGFFGDFSMLSALTNLEHLDLNADVTRGADGSDVTHFTGDISAFSGLTQLTHLDINSNLNSIPGPGCGFVSGDLLALSKLTKLQWLDLGAQNITGSLDDLTKLSQLTYLDLGFQGGYQGSGGITLGTTATFNFPLLSHLDLSESNLDSDQGHWAQLSELTQLTSLSLERFAMSGRIGDGLSNLALLTHLDLYFATISAQLSDFSNLKHLTYLALSGASVSGRMDDLSNLTQLAYLDLDYCGIGGSIPSSLARLSRLDTLGVACNGFTGTVPPLPIFRIPAASQGGFGCFLYYGGASQCDGRGTPNAFECPLPPGAKENCHGVCTKGGRLRVLSAP